MKTFVKVFLLIVLLVVLASAVFAMPVKSGVATNEFYVNKNSQQPFLPLHL